MDFFVFSAYQDSDIKNKKGDCSIYLSSTITTMSINPLIQTLQKEFKAVVLEENESEYRNKSTLAPFLRFLANQDSNFDMKHKFQEM